MSAIRLIIASLVHHWRVNLAVACGVAAGAAVLVGALLVGDSMRESLRRLTLDRLGRIDQVMVATAKSWVEISHKIKGIACLFQVTGQCQLPIGDDPHS